MRLVGPRPHANAHNEEYRRKSGLHAAAQGPAGHHRPGPGQRLARRDRHALQNGKRIEFDHRYIREWSLWMDLKILLKTVIVVISRKNAY